MTTKYKTALDKSSIAIQKFAAIQKDYHSMKINDSEFLAGKQKFKAAMEEYDAAFADESEEHAMQVAMSDIDAGDFEANEAQIESEITNDADLERIRKHANHVSVI